MEQSRRIAGLNLGDVIERYGVALTGAFGVLHDGYKVLPGVNEALQRARSFGKKVVVVTNSPQRIEGTRLRLESVGVKPESYDAITSSGELAWRDLEERNRTSGKLPRLHFIIEGAGVRWLGDVRNDRVEMADADILIAAGTPYATDQWRADCISAPAHPHVKTPNLDALAADGVLFESHFGQWLTELDQTTNMQLSRRGLISRP